MASRGEECNAPKLKKTVDPLLAAVLPSPAMENDSDSVGRWLAFVAVLLLIILWVVYWIKQGVV